MTKILAIDDEPRNLMILEELLEENYEFHQASNGPEGIELFNKVVPDLILLDIMMPEVNGYEVCKTIKSSPKGEHCRIILVSGKTMLEEKILGYEVGADDYITKPFEHDELLAKVKVFSNLTEAEKQIIELNKSLEKQVELRTNQLIKTEKMAFIGAHTAEVVHNLNNPLSVIKAHSSRLAKEQPENKRAQHIAKAVNKIEDMIKMILDAGRRESSLEKKPLNINEIIQNELELLQTDKFFKYDIVVEKNFNKLPPLIGVYSNFSQILGNLIKNAAEAMYDQPEKILSLVTEKEDKSIVVKIKDTGTGIPQENLEKLFDPFFTTKPIEAESDEPTGTGLGLSSVKKMVESYGGTIEINSQENVGTEFVLTFPVSIISHFSDPVAA